jgi:hypothetical protein
MSIYGSCKTADSHIITDDNFLMFYSLFFLWNGSNMWRGTICWWLVRTSSLSKPMSSRYTSVRLLLAPILNFALFCIQYIYMLKFLRKIFDLAIIQKDTIFPRIPSIRSTELSLYSVCAEPHLAYTHYTEYTWNDPSFHNIGTIKKTYF